MPFRFELSLGLLIALALMASRHEPVAPVRELRVCADPNNLPFSNQRGEGFENRIASVIATDLGLSVRYTWQPQRRGFVRNTLNFGRCDVILGIPATFDPVARTRPYYRSTYVLVTRRDRGLHIRSLDDSVLRRLRIGIHVAGGDYPNPPAEKALAERGLARNVVVYNLYGDYSKPNPAADLITAVARREVDVAIVWGPLAGYFARRERVPLDLTPVTPSTDLPSPFVSAIAAGVRRGDTQTRDRIQAALDRHEGEIRGILENYGVPLVSGGGT
jgi:quinoprotein dehydrogenase-associated probable ABC transporter substrate-binding protein